MEVVCGTCGHPLGQGLHFNGSEWVQCSYCAPYADLLPRLRIAVEALRNCAYEATYQSDAQAYALKALNEIGELP